MIDAVSADELIEAGYSKDATERARETVESFEQFIEDNRDEIAALQILYGRPHTQRLTFARSRSSRTRSAKPPRQWTPEHALAGIRGARLLQGRGSGHGSPHRPRLSSFASRSRRGRARPVPRASSRERTTPGCSSRRTPDTTFTPEQLAWLERIRDTIAASLGISRRRPDGPAASPNAAGSARQSSCSATTRPAARRTDAGAGGVTSCRPGGTGNAGDVIETDGSSPTATGRDQGSDPDGEIRPDDSSRNRAKQSRASAQRSSRSRQRLVLTLEAATCSVARIPALSRIALAIVVATRAHASRLSTFASSDPATPCDSRCL